MINMVSVSGGKDSAVTYAIALETRDPDTVLPYFADTGNEHQITLDYLDYLEQRFNRPITRIRQDFAPRFAHKRDYILNQWPLKGVSAETVERAAALLVPSGNPYLDLCMLKGRFPSRMAQFCTQELKTIPMDREACKLIDQHGAVLSWHGIRRNESLNRKDAKMFESAFIGGLFIYRPIVRWTADQVFAYHRTHDIKPNPLYLQGMGRVGCMPCINASKAEVMEIARRFPEHIARIADWERIVAGVSRPGAASFFAAPEDGRGELRGRSISEYVNWSRTSRGGRSYDLDAFMPPSACSSVYGLCE